MFSLSQFVRLSVCVSVRPFTFEVPFKRLFAPTSRSWMSKIFRYAESLGKSNKKKWSQIWTFLFGSGLKARPKKKLFFLLILPYKTCWKPRFPMDERPLVKGYITTFSIYLDVFECLRFGWSLPLKKKKGFLGILGPPYRGIGATISIGREMICLPYAGFFVKIFNLYFLQLEVYKYFYQ